MSIRAPASSKLASLLGHLGAGRYLFVRPGGNYGDYLIYYGMHRLARDMGIIFSEMSHSEFLKARPDRTKTVYIHGSGGFVPWWSGNPITAFTHALTHYKTVILGPTTFHADVEYVRGTLPSMKGRSAKTVYAFAREAVSFEIITSAFSGCAETILDHDTALNLDPQDAYRIFDGKKRIRLFSGYVLHAFRDDTERLRRTAPNPFRAPIDPVRSSNNEKDWFDLHARAREIYTDRSHSAILGSLLGKKTRLLPNNYHKNRGVWEFSLRERGVEWLDGMPTTGWEKLHLSTGFSRIMNIRSVKRFYTRLYFGKNIKSSA